MKKTKKGRPSGGKATKSAMERAWGRLDPRTQNRLFDQAVREIKREANAKG